MFGKSKKELQFEIEQLKCKIKALTPSPKPKTQRLIDAEIEVGSYQPIACNRPLPGFMLDSYRRAIKEQSVAFMEWQNGTK